MSRSVTLKSPKQPLWGLAWRGSRLGRGTRKEIARWGSPPRRARRLARTGFPTQIGVPDFAFGKKKTFCPRYWAGRCSSSICGRQCRVGDSVWLPSCRPRSGPICCWSFRLRSLPASDNLLRRRNDWCRHRLLLRQCHRRRNRRCRPRCHQLRNRFGEVAPARSGLSLKPFRTVVCASAWTSVWALFFFGRISGTIPAGNTTLANPRKTQIKNSPSGEFF